jgi:hypothetical protein
MQSSWRMPLSGGYRNFHHPIGRTLERCGGSDYRAFCCAAASPRIRTTSDLPSLEAKSAREGLVLT